MKDTSTFNFTKLSQEGKFVNALTNEDVRMISFPGQGETLYFNQTFDGCFIKIRENFSKVVENLNLISILGDHVE